MLEPKLVFIEWLDSSQTHGWNAVEDIPTGISKCQSVGWLIADSDESKTLAPHVVLGDQPGFPNQGCGVMSIPVCCIVRIETIPSFSPVSS